MKQHNAVLVYLILNGSWALFFTIIVTVASVYRITVVDMSPFQLVMTGTALELAVFLFEVPTGVIADVYSRRLFIIIGTVITGVAFMLQGAIPVFGLILLTEALWGIGYTFTSGAQEAWLTGEIGSANVAPVYLRTAQVSQACALIGMVISVTLASLHIQLPLVLGGGLYLVLAAYLVLAMPERGFRPMPREGRTSWQAMGHTLQCAGGLIRRQPVLITILLIGAVYGMSSEAFDRLWEARILADFSFPQLGRLQPIVWFGIINVVSMGLGIGALQLARRRLDAASQQATLRFLALINAALTASMIAFGLAGNLGLALASYWAARLFRDVNDPVYRGWVNQSIQNDDVRATLISVSSQADAMGQILGGPMLGAIGSWVSSSAAIITAGLILSPILLLYRLATRLNEGQPQNIA